MKILIYATNKNDLDILYTHLEKVSLKNWQIDKIDDESTFIKKFNKNEYDKIYIDFSDDIGSRLIKMISNQKPKQELFMINSEYACVEEKDCMYCVSEYNRKSLVKPLNHNVIKDSLKTNRYKCDKMLKTEFDFKLKKLKREFNLKNPKVDLRFNRIHKQLIACPYSVDIFNTLKEDISKLDIDFNVVNEGVVQINN